jgi:hypothetical protein
VRVQVAVRADVIAVGSLRSGAIDQMFGLYSSYYDATSRALFESDLDGKDFVVVLSNQADMVVGFSTLAILTMEVGGTSLRAIYSGDTIIERAHWGTQALAFTWLRFAGTIKAQVPTLPLYWFLIVKGHRTYRYLSAFAIEFFPHWALATPSQARAIMHALARQRFRDDYDAERGVVSFARSRGHLKPRWAGIEPDEAARSDVNFFLRRNPGYTRGDELVCLTELSSANLRPLARRVFDQGLRG